ncbi:MAG TPA: carbamoyltransferase HypF [Deltaproteobacteria bacterium]|nr:carbamoyltransferase HypF [Deltaproteobacteria bacterium]
MIRRVRLRFSGIVQGVGFRPFIYRLAVSHGLTGFVQNRQDGVVVELQGRSGPIESFMARCMKELPPLAQVSDLTTEDIEPSKEDSFRIVPSEEEGRPEVHISPDAATCDDCLAELFDPEDRRHRYPFINCTNCGPRLTIITGIPYDRKNTSMNAFPLCERCGREYGDPRDRRFHAEPNACPVCGPELTLLDEKGEKIECSDPVEKAIELLREGYVVVVKGIGGFHLAADASSSEALSRLRERKYREEKPFAVMVKDLPHARALAEITSWEEELLSNPERPIVLVKKKAADAISPLVAPGMANLGIMLPYAPLHHLLLEGGFPALVMTSANQTDEPICIDNDEALKRLKGIADYYLLHNRDIIVRCDDSVATVVQRAPRLMRRSRGYVPKPIIMPRSYPTTLGLGGHLKSTTCIIKGDFAFLSPHIGDMETPEARDFFHESVALMRHLTKSDPEIVACDMHPEYYTTWVAAQMSQKRVVQVQHHHAHIASCMAENRITGDVIGLSMDGTGYGLDGKIWGGEFLVADEADFQRAGHIRYFPLPGGDAAVKQPWRVAAAFLMENFGDDWRKAAEELSTVPDHIPYDTVETVVKKRLQTVYTSSLGRIFDAVSCLLGIRRKVSFEGQAAMELEACAGISPSRILSYDILMDREIILDLYPMIRQLAEERMAGKPVSELASAFHATLIHAFVRTAREIRDATGLNRVVLSGGCFQNRILLEGCISSLDLSGFDVYTHHLVPANDGGISLGQAYVAGTVAG